MLTLTLPTREGWYVEWETGEIKEFHRKDGSVRKTIQAKESIETTDKEKALRIKAEKEAQGFKNVMMGECIF